MQSSRSSVAAKKHGIIGCPAASSACPKSARDSTGGQEYKNCSTGRKGSRHVASLQPGLRQVAEGTASVRLRRKTSLRSSLAAVLAGSGVDLGAAGEALEVPGCAFLVPVTVLVEVAQVSVHLSLCCHAMSYNALHPFRQHVFTRSSLLRLGPSLCLSSSKQLSCTSAALPVISTMRAACRFMSHDLMLIIISAVPFI